MLRTSGFLLLVGFGALFSYDQLTPAAAAERKARESMERCVSSVLNQLARAQAAEADVGPRGLIKVR